MLTGKQRSYLKSIANGIKPITQIGKEGVTQAFLNQLDDALEAREIVKVTVLENSGLSAKEIANEVAKAARAEFVQAIGSKFTIYRKSIDNPTIELPKK
ncbi:ribosome assembly RNA-binding protein YhbY [Tepidibacter formicigenes]|jgi:RNA-binding protein|uniref:RNA-binding protein n=1 Tax=Tepidibacter formicigenes DSM 15518 TaxID=1123349 RepID=A0A1M6JYM8_9FIRM|nr:ribosome assembly RNA-binding protein YhbY [Tepidibacter formicigenes]SHJ51778.1 RNA-binding protein [Tepidibacter formicigenes DSM 15518]